MKKDTIISIVVAVIGVIIIILVGVQVMDVQIKQIDDFCNKTNGTGYSNTGDVTVNCSKITQAINNTKI